MTTGSKLLTAVRAKCVAGGGVGMTTGSKLLTAKSVARVGSA